MRVIITNLEARWDLLKRKRAQFDLVAQQSGVIFGEDLPRMVGQYFQHGQATYRVELTIENIDGSLRPGMTAFARIDFDRQVVGRILLHKVKQALRPELWML